MIELEAVSKSFRGVRALDRISVSLRPGTVTVVAGADGAGKSTLLKAAVGLVRIDAGRILFRGRPVGVGFRDLRRVTGYLPEKFALYPDLTVGETLRFLADIHGVKGTAGRSRTLALLEKTGLRPFADRRTAALSGGMRQKLALCAALCSSPDVLVLDEPTAGIDPLSRLDIARLIAELKAEGKSILASTSDLNDAETADEILYLKNGRTIVAGSVSKLKADFPEKILRLVPDRNVLPLIPIILGDSDLRKSAVIRGNILYCRKNAFGKISHLGWITQEEIAPSLEDICLFVEQEAERLRRP